MRCIRFGTGIVVGLALGVATPLLAQWFTAPYGNVGVRFNSTINVFCVDQAAAAVLEHSEPRYSIQPGSYLTSYYRQLVVSC